MRKYDYKIIHVTSGDLHNPKKHDKALGVIQEMDEQGWELVTSTIMMGVLGGDVGSDKTALIFRKPI